MLAEIGITNVEEQVQWYSVFGEIPKYYVVAQEQGLHGMDIHSALKILLFKDFALLKEEARSLLIEDFGSEHASYFSILEAVALGNSEMTTLMDKSVSVDWGVKDGDWNRYFVAISKSVFTKKAEEFAKENHFLLFTLDDFGGVFH